jgi:hypothetical protein
MRRRGIFLKLPRSAADTAFVKTLSTQANFPGGRRWHGSLPLVATSLTCLVLVGTVGFAGFAARQLAVARDRETAVHRLRDQLRSATERLERANRLIAATAKVVQAASRVQEVDRAVAEQRETAAGLTKTTRETIAALKADKSLTPGAREKAIAKLNAETKAQLAALAAKEKEWIAQRQPLAEHLSEELGQLLAAFVAETASAKKAPAPPTEAPVAAVKEPATGTVAAPAGEIAAEGAPGEGARGVASATGDGTPSSDVATAPAADPSGGRPDRQSALGGIGAGKKVEP